MRTYEDIGLDNNLQPRNSPIATARGYSPGYRFESRNEVQGNYLRASKLNLTGLAMTSVGGSGTASFSAGSALNLTSTITFKVPYQNKAVFGNAYVSIYQGTALTSNDQIYPIRGANVTLGRYNVQGWYDYHTWDFIKNTWRGLLVDTTGTSSQVITFSGAWVYLDYTAGSAV